MENLLPTLVQPKLRNIDIQEISRQSEDSEIEDGKAIYVIEVPDSENAPHQALDQRYYGRVASSSKPLDHQWIMDIIGRRKYPKMEKSFAYGYVNEDDANHCLREGQQPVLLTRIKNSGQIYAKYVNSILYIPEYLVIIPPTTKIVARKIVIDSVTTQRNESKVLNKQEE